MVKAIHYSEQSMRQSTKHTVQTDESKKPVLESCRRDSFRNDVDGGADMMQLARVN